MLKERKMINKIINFLAEFKRRKNLVCQELKDVKVAIVEVFKQLSHILPAIKGEARKGRKKK